MSLEARSEKMKTNIEYIIERNRGWGFQEASLTYDLPLDLLVLPCSWFDPGWLESVSPFDYIFDDTTVQYDFNNFYAGSFCYHWHNHWNKKVHPHCAVGQNNSQKLTIE